MPVPKKSGNFLNVPHILESMKIRSQIFVSENGEFTLNKY